MADIFVIDGPGATRVFMPMVPSLDMAITSKVAEIKAEAERRITALDWRLQRAQEREQLGQTGFETVADVLALREQIRQASNAAELVVATLASTEEVLAFTW
ncbi:hypothetical protein ACSZND_00015 [Aeromonas hydrophila]|uniref:hypothetical protein n=1 Tax=Aeromonas TaxID=642 RepID=UPI00111B5A95|nr:MULTISPECIES: hypothetical protein [Aeromonas]MCX4103544.1 hypothetical protein [Aeromonas hydrophila]TNJ17215.1 hypothetical protein CF112_19675 [Aeromonas hydrophila]